MGTSSTAFPNAQAPIVSPQGLIKPWFLQWLVGGGINVVVNLSSGSSEVTGTLPVGNGGTGDTTLTNHAVLLGAGTSAIASVGPGTTGQVLRAQTGANPIYGAVNLATDVTGILPQANGGWGVAPSVVTLTDAQIKALPTTTMTLVAAPGTGFRIRPMAVSYSFTTTSGAYTNINTTYADLHLLLGTDYVGYGPVNDSTTTPTLTLISSVLGTAATRIFDQGLPPQQSTPVAANNGYVQTIAFYNRNQQENAALMLKMDNNGSGNLTGGNAANSLKVSTYYVIEAL